MTWAFMFREESILSESIPSLHNNNLISLPVPGDELTKRLNYCEIIKVCTCRLLALKNGLRKPFYFFIKNNDHQNPDYNKNIGEVEGGPEFEGDEVGDGA